MSKKREVSTSFLVVGILLLVGVAAYFVLLPRLQPSTTLRVGDGVFHAKFMSGETARQKYLPNMQALSASESLLLVFDSSKQWEMNSSNLAVPVDIAWINKDKKIVHIVKNIDPRELAVGTTFSPKETALYLTVFAAGIIDARNIRIGQEATFEDTYNEK